ncbi:MAG: hypothetical protein R6V10_08785 [bacterium]
MKCPLLKGKSVRRCGAVNVAVLLNSHDLEKYCLNDNYAECPVYRKLKAENQDRLSLKEYYLVSGRDTTNTIDPGSDEMTA